MRALSTIICFAALSTVLSATPAAASATYWQVGMAVGSQDGGISGTIVGVASWGRDHGFDGGDVPTLDPSWGGVFVRLYREHGAGWSGPTAFYDGDFDATAFASGESRTWSDIYLWAQNYTPAPGTLTGIRVHPPFGPPPPPAGYVGHLVLDQVPQGYSGPMDWWLDLTHDHDLLLPIPVVTDPLQGTRFHLTVYAPAVPEPGSLVALFAGLTGLGGVALRRRRG